MCFGDWLQFLVATMLSVCLLIIIACYERRRRRKWPGPKGFPFIGILLQLGDIGAFHKQVTAFGRRYGKIFGFKLLGKRAVVLRSASIVGRALNGMKCLDRKETFFQKFVFNDKGFAFANYCEKVPDLRKVFHNSLYWKWQERESTDKWLQLEVARTITTLTEKAGSDINTDDSFRRLMTNIYASLLMGETLPEDDPDRNALWELINCLYLLIEPSNDGPLRAMPFLRHLPGKHGRLFRSTIKARDRVAQRYFDTQKSTFQEGRIRGLIDVCLQMQADGRREDGEFWLTDEYIKGLVYDTVVAGMTEMMKSLRILVLLMCHHQDIQSRVHTEINDVIRENTPSCSHRQEMPYTQAVILEMLRYVSQTPLAIPHKCNKDIILDGYLIEKDSGILPNIWGIHHDEEVWGDPWVFRPERFLDENSQLIPKDHKLMKSLIPFSVGKRRCPGENFAMSRTFLTFVSLLQQLRFAPPEDQELPSADPRLYTNKYPLHLPKYTCRAVPRREEPRREEPRPEEKSS